MCKLHSSRLVRVRTANTQTMDSLIASEASGRNENAENVADLQIQNILFSIWQDFSLDKTHTHTHLQVGYVQKRTPPKSENGPCRCTTNTNPRTRITQTPRHGRWIDCFTHAHTHAHTRSRTRIRGAEKFPLLSTDSETPKIKSNAIDAIYMTTQR